MSIYQYPATSPVGGITFRYANDRPPVALLEAGSATPEHLDTVRRAIAAQGWQGVPVHVDGKQVLQVDGFSEAGQLAAFLKAYHFTSGDAKIIAEEGDHPTRSIGEWTQAMGLKGAGWLNLVGDVALLGSGVMSGRSKEVTAGALYTAGAGVLARYGNVKTEHHIRQVAERTAEFLQKEAPNLPEDCGLFTILKNKRDGIVNHTENFLYRYPAEVMLGAYTLGAFTMLQSGLKQGNPWGVAYGANSLGLKAASLLIPEKKQTEEEKAASGPVGKFVGWVQEKPLRVFGFGSLVTDTLLGLSAYREYRNDPKQRSYILKFITTATYIAADLLIAVSNKNHANGEGKFDPEEQRRLEGLAAEAIARQPKEMREPLAHHVAGFLSQQPEMKGNAADIGNAIIEQVQHMERNPWACRTGINTGQPTAGIS